MKIGIINYTHGGYALEIIGETDAEYMILHEIWTHGEMSRGNGQTALPGGMKTGFYLQPKKKDGP